MTKQPLIGSTAGVTLSYHRPQLWLSPVEIMLSLGKVACVAVVAEEEDGDHVRSRASTLCS